MKLFIVAILAFSAIAFAQAVPSERATAALAKVHAQLEASGYKLDCDAPKAYALEAKNWDDSIQAAVEVLTGLEFEITDAVMLEPELGLAIIDTDPNDPSAYGFGILEIGLLTVEECWVTKP